LNHAPTLHLLLVMKVLPLCFLDSLTEVDLLRHECSDRIWVGRSAFERFTASGDAGIAAIVILSNRVDQRVPAVTHAAHYDDEETIYVPNWILQELFHDTEEVTCERFSPSLGTQITILPHTSDHLRLRIDPETLLRDGFEQYTCLVRGMDYAIWLGEHSFTVTLTDLNPQGQEIVCIRGNEIELELLAPLDRPVTPPRPATPLPPAPEPVAAPLGAAAPAPQPPTHSEEERRALIAAATRRRLALRQTEDSN
jgi:hypothetical protein